jgi:cyclic pyranopterin phosphate synthase
MAQAQRIEAWQLEAEWCEAGASAEARERFAWFGAHGGKLRVAITDACNLDCFFCHNEGMANPRRLPLVSSGRRLGDAELAAIIDAMCALGAPQVNITGGEPLAHPGLFDILDAIDKRSTRIALNTNALLAERLLRRPRLAAIDQILASLHTTDDETFRRELKGKRAARVMAGIVSLARHGYRVAINYSLGDYNADAFAAVLELALAHAIDLKVIALVRHDHDPDFYRGRFVDPAALDAVLAAAGAERIDARVALGGVIARWRAQASQIEVKNIASGRARTDLCLGCHHEAACGEGIYGLRVGVDGFWKPCLLAREKRRAVLAGVSLERQILAMVAAMVGDPSRLRLAGGALA